MWRPISILMAVLMAVASVTFIMASFVHFGNTIPLGVVTLNDPFPNAAIPEGIIAAVMVVGVVAVLTRVWWLALATTVFATAGTILGLSIVLLGFAWRTGDIVYHVSILTVLVVTIGLVITPAARQAFRRQGA